MKLNLATMDLARSFEQPAFHDSGVTSSDDVPIVEFSGHQLCEHEMQFDRFGNLTQRADGRSCLRLRRCIDASTRRLFWMMRLSGDVPRRLTNSPAGALRNKLTHNELAHAELRNLNPPTD